MSIILRICLQRVGDKTPADLIIFASTDLKVDNSSLTGESEPQERFAKPNGSPARPVEAENLVSLVHGNRMPVSFLISFAQIFNSTLVVNGEGWGGRFFLYT